MAGQMTLTCKLTRAVRKLESSDDHAADLELTVGTHSQRLVTVKHILFIFSWFV